MKNLTTLDTGCPENLMDAKGKRWVFTGNWRLVVMAESEGLFSPSLYPQQMQLLRKLRIP